MATNLCELIARNQQLLDGRSLLVVGDLDDSALIPLLKETSSATLLVDNYVCYKQIAAMLGAEVNSERVQSCAYKQLTVHFATLPAVLKGISKVDTLLLFLTKNKQASKLLLSEAQSLLTAEATILIAGSNSGGGKSANSLLREAGAPYKVDSARKCTLFSIRQHAPFAPVPQPSYLSYASLRLKQHPLVFSAGEVDTGSRMLLEALAEESLMGEVLDLGCGSGIVGLTLCDRSEISRISFADVSAQALELTADNLRANSISKPYEVIASDMLQNTGLYDAICVNPPFHQGLSHDNRAAQLMIAKAPSHLKAGGSLYLVGNTFLHYEKVLAEHFATVRILKQTGKFTVFKATP